MTGNPEGGAIDPAGWGRVLPKKGSISSVGEGLALGSWQLFLQLSPQNHKHQFSWCDSSLLSLPFTRAQGAVAVNVVLYWPFKEEPISS